MTENRLEYTYQIPENSTAIETIMHAMEIAATDHVSMQQLSGKDLEEQYEAFWMLSRAMVRLHRPITGPCELKLVTSHRGLAGVLAYRDFEVYLNDEHLGEAIQAWVIAKIDGRKIVRPQTIDAFEAIQNRSTKTQRLAKLSPPEGLEPVGEYHVASEDIDINGHMNNARYVLLAHNFLPEGFLPTGFQVGYLKERRQGQCIKLYLAKTDDGCFVRGCIEDGTPCFDVRFFS